VQIKVVKDMIEEFVPNNYIEEIKIAQENEIALLMGGADSVVNKMTKEFDVDLNVSWPNHVVTARGKKENVLVAKKRLNQFLHGGDGHSVSKIIVLEQAIGSVIGKGGSWRVELEEKHDEVKIAIEPSSGIIMLLWTRCHCPSLQNGDFQYCFFNPRSRVHADNLWATRRTFQAWCSENRD
jgi:polyribonucleotide nucleotidyltransferase